MGIATSYLYRNNKETYENNQEVCKNTTGPTKIESDEVKNLKEIINIQQKKIYELSFPKNEESFKEYENLVFSGGGIKGVSYCGVIDALDELNILYNNSELKIKGFAGASAGAMIASLMAIGYKPNELKDIMKKLDFRNFIQCRMGYLGEAVNFFEKYGCCSGQFIIDFLGELIKNKFGNPDYTIEDLYLNQGINLVIVATNLNRLKSVYFYHDNPKIAFRKIPIRVAIRISIGIPFLFEPFLYDKDLYADGGVLDNYPLHVFDGDYPGDIKARLNITKANPKTLGINIMTKDDIIGYDISPRQEIKSLVQYSWSFINLFLSENERRMMIPSFWKRSIILITPDYALNEFYLNDEQKTELIEIGRKATFEFFS